MSFIHVGDIHCKEKQPFKQASLNFLNWLLENYKEETIIQGGDFFDSSSHQHKYMDEIIQIISQFKDFRIINGNHDQSARLGSILFPLRQHKNITIYDGIFEIIIDDINLILLPFQNSYKDYENLKVEDYRFDYSINHFTPIQEAFSNEGIELKFKVNTAHIFNHIHRHREFIDNFGNNVLITGSIMDTRFGEQGWEKNIYRVSKESYEKISVPQFFTYETVSYGEVPESKDNIINVIDAPNKKLVFEKYKEYYIREAGIKLLRTENTQGTFKQEFESTNILQKFKKYSIDKALSKEVSEECSSRLLNII